MRPFLWATVALCCFVVQTTCLKALETKVGSKAFTESVVLGEIISQIVQQSGAQVIHHRQLGGTRILWEALRAGEIDVYPEYTGTLTNEILAGQTLKTKGEPAEYLESLGLRIGGVIGFNNTYAVAMAEGTAARLGIRTISDLASHPDLSFGFSNEFMDRQDGWPGLQTTYLLSQQSVFGLDHDLAYRGLVAEDIDATDVYSTDAEIEYYGLTVLEDDKYYFPTYNAVLIYRIDWATDHPRLEEALQTLVGTISESDMAAMNAEVKIAKRTEADVAAHFLLEKFGKEINRSSHGMFSAMWVNTLDHLMLVSISLLAAIVIAIPLGIAAAWYAGLGHLILMAVGIVQTIPSLAMFVFMIPLVGIGGPPAILALFLYSLLPIVRNTHAGLKNIPSEILEAADVMGLSAGARLRIVELPMAARTILAGIKTSSVINVGTATLGALIGAGGYGQPILTGIRLDDVGLILSGAVPAAALALLVQGCFELGERYMTPRGLR
jgi:osmoprotectant transport system permease protein